MLAPLLMTACATVGPPQPPSLELAKPPSDLRAVRKGDRVTLTWTIPTVTTDRQTVRSMGQTRICRTIEKELTQCGAPVGEAIVHPDGSAPRSSKQKPAGSYTDALPVQVEGDNPNALATYAIEVLNAEGRGAGLSNQVRVSLVRTLPPPQDFAALVTSKGVVLTWGNDLPPTGHAPPEHYLYRVFRGQEGTPQRTIVGETPAASERLVLTDENIEWEKTYSYRVTVVTVARSSLHACSNRIDNDTVGFVDCIDEVKVEGEDSPEVKVFAHDVFPPGVPAGLQAVFSGPGQAAFIDLIWAPVTDVDLDGYNVYRHEEGAAPVKVNAERLKTPAYRDMSVFPGKKYFYSVSAVDVRGNESARSEEASETVP